MKKMIRAVLIFFFVCMASAGLGWISGYNFDYRSGGVAFWAGMSFFLAVYLGGSSYLFD